MGKEIDKLELRNGHQLTIKKDVENREHIILSKEKNTLFTIVVSDTETTLSINATDINLTATNKLNINAQNIEIESKRDTKISCLGDYKSYVKGDTMHLSEGNKLDIAKTQMIKSDLGNVDVVANDDVTLKGERVKLN